MFSPQKIKEISKVSKAEKWTFPKTLNALRDAGVKDYNVEFSSCTITYHGSGQKMIESDAASLKNLLPCGSSFDLKGLVDAIKIHQVKQTPYSEVVKEMVRAGVVHYRVDVIARTCTYFGTNPNEEYVEKFEEYIEPRQAAEIF
jgi:uncharacterized protein YbcV (DUF1398 family)